MEAENLAESEYPALHMGIGVHAGEVVVGNIGSESRAKYGIIGSAVNLTHRIQGQAQGGEVMISEMVLHHSEETLAVRRTFQTTAQGHRSPGDALCRGRQAANAMNDAKNPKCRWPYPI